MSAPAQRPARQGLRRRLDGLLGLLVCLALTAVVAVQTPDPETMESERTVVPGVAGQWAEVDGVRVRVSQVTLTSEVTDPGAKETVQPLDGVVVLVTVELEWTTPELRMVTLRLADREGRTYRLSGDRADTTTGRGFRVVWPRYAAVPRDALPGLRLTAARVFPTSSFYFPQRQLDVDLGPLDQAPVAASETLPAARVEVVR